MRHVKYTPEQAKETALVQDHVVDLASSIEHWAQAGGVHGKTIE